MSQVKVQGNASGTGIFTIASPNSNSDRTLTLPDEAGTVLTSASAVAASQITSALNASGSAPIYACRAWVNFSGSGTVAIRASGNVTSITDNGTGNYTVNFTTAMPDVHYSVTGMTSDVGGVGNVGVVSLYTGITTPAVGSFRIFTHATGTQSDNAYIYLSVFR